MAKTTKQRLAKFLKRAEKHGFSVNNHLLIRKMQLKLKATPHELRLKEMLDALKLHATFQKGFVAGGVMYIADFYLRKPWKMVIEVDGPSHWNKAQRMKDAVRDNYFRQRRHVRVLRLTNEEVARYSLVQLKARLDECRLIPLRPSEGGCYDRLHDECESHCDLS